MNCCLNEIWVRGSIPKVYMVGKSVADSDEENNAGQKISRAGLPTDDLVLKLHCST